MNAKASQAILRAYETGRDFAVFDMDAERYLLNGGYAERTTKPPLMRLTWRGKAYAQKEIAWMRTKKG